MNEIQDPNPPGSETPERSGGAQPSEDSFKNDLRLLWQKLGLWKPLLRMESLLFVMVSLGDLVMTTFLLYSNRFRESNPIAEFFINHWGVRGMILFKVGLVFLVLIITQVVAKRKIGLARRVIQGGTLLVGGVIVYSLFLAMRH